MIAAFPTNVFEQVGASADDEIFNESSAFPTTRDSKDPNAPPDLRLKASLMKLPYQDDRINDPEIQDWMRSRQLGVGASEIAVLFGLSPWQTLEELWQEKKRRVND